MSLHRRCRRLAVGMLASLAALVACAERAAIVRHDVAAVERSMAPDWGAPVLTYDSFTLGHLGSSGQTTVQLYRYGAICYRRNPSEGFPGGLHEEFALNETTPKPRGLPDSWEERLRFEALVVRADLKERAGAGGSEDAPLCAAIDVHADPREGGTFDRALQLGRERVRALERRLLASPAVDRVLVRNHGWSKTAVLHSSQRSQAKVFVELAPDCTSVPVQSAGATLEVAGINLESQLQRLTARMQPLVGQPLSEAPFSPHATLTTISWNGADDGGPPTEGTDRGAERVGAAVWDHLHGESVPNRLVFWPSTLGQSPEAAEVARLQEIFDAMLDNGCRLSPAGL